MTTEQFNEIYYSLDMTQNQLSFCLGVTSPMVRYYLTGHSPIPDDIANQMMELMEENK